MAITKEVATEAVDEISENEMLVEYFARHLLSSALSLIVTWVGAKILRSLLKIPSKSASGGEALIVKRLVRAGVEKSKLRNLSAFEVAIAHELVFPEDVQTSFQDIGGLVKVKRALRDIVILPLLQPELFRANPLLNPPGGLLLYGPPGTGKTMLAKALAKESGARFINIAASTILSKWVGETNRLVRAIFSFAARVSPCIIFIDEMDALFRERAAGDHEAYRDMKAEFMQLWDGLLTSPMSSIMVVGATNRPWDIDQAILRRMPRTFMVDYPDIKERENILRTVLQNSSLEEQFDFVLVASKMEGYSGSDISELCRGAMQVVVREHLRSQGLTDSILDEDVPPLKANDVLLAMQRLKPTKKQSAEYLDSQKDANAAQWLSDVDVNALRAWLERLPPDLFSGGFSQATV